MRRLRFGPAGMLAFASLGLLPLWSCGSNQSATDGRSLYESKGCASCHGDKAEGRVGPALVDLYGSTVTVTDRDNNETEVYADGDYLRESLTDPGAQRTVGYRTVMPNVNLTDEQVETLVAYIESLSSVPPDVTVASTTSHGSAASPEG